MTRKKWFRLYHGMTHDMALAVAAQQAGLSRGDMIALWLCLLDHASQSTPAGCIAQFEHDETALLLGLQAEQIKAALTALRARKKIDSHQRISGWDKYQPSSTARVRALRARQKLSPRSAPTPPVAQQPPVRARVDDDSPAAIAARRARLQHNNALIIGQPPRGA